jgi:hypothetical protein
MSEWININIPWGPAYKYDPITFESLPVESFTYKGLNKEGTLIDLEDGRQLLIGHINVLAGECDDCTSIHNDTIIKRYKIVWEAK